MQFADKTITSILPINSEPLGAYRIPEKLHKNFQQQLDRAWTEADDNLRSTEGNISHICNSGDQNIFSDFPLLQGLERYIESCCLNYLEQIGFESKGLIITDAWLNVTHSGARLLYHNHSNSFVSGTYFINFNPEKHSKLYFLNDRCPSISYFDARPKLTLPLSENCSKFLAKSMSPDIQSGCILLWRSHVMHGFEEPNHEDGRFTLSFNIMPKKCVSRFNRYSFGVTRWFSSINILEPGQHVTDATL